MDEVTDGQRTLLEAATGIVGQVARCVMGSTAPCFLGGVPADDCYCASAARRILALAAARPTSDARTEALLNTFGEAYQAVGIMAKSLGYFEMAADNPDRAAITKLLDNLRAAADEREPPHKDLLPFSLAIAAI